MKYKKYISVFSVLILVLVFFAGSTGITLILHNCPSCKDFSVKTGLYLAPVAPEDHCCDYADQHPGTHTTQENISMACHFKINRLKFDNFTSDKTKVIPPVLNKPILLNPHEVNALPGETAIQHIQFHNKHGGRYKVTYNCQLIS